jgi:hypothetical protein
MTLHASPAPHPISAGIQAMLDIYAETGMIKQKLDVPQFRHPKLVAPTRIRWGLARDSRSVRGP